VKLKARKLDVAILLERKQLEKDKVVDQANKMCAKIRKMTEQLKAKEMILESLDIEMDALRQALDDQTTGDSPGNM
jgi:hypothetical protein